MVMKGRELFRECSRTVFKLSTIRRVSDDKQDDKDMLGRIRLGTAVLDKDVAKIQSLHLTNMQQVHGADTVKALSRDAVFLFYTNEKRIAHNIQQLATMNTPENPTAIVKAISGNKALGKGVACHFSGGAALTALICKGATVSIQGRNFYPSWGLHNGACGVVQEIVFQPGHSPNTGHQPTYVVVSFPLYIGPVWDVDEPKVSYISSPPLIHLWLHALPPPSVNSHTAHQRSMQIQLLWTGVSSLGTFVCSYHSSLPGLASGTCGPRQNTQYLPSYYLRSRLKDCRGKVCWFVIHRPIQSYDIRRRFRPSVRYLFHWFPLVAGTHSNPDTQNKHNGSTRNCKQKR